MNNIVTIRQWKWEWELKLEKLKNGVKPCGHSLRSSTKEHVV